MIVETKVIGQPVEFGDRLIDQPAGTRTLRALLADLVRIEVENYELRRTDQLVLRILSPADLDAGRTTGSFVSRREVPAAPTPEVAIERAIEAFADGLYLVILDGKQVDDLDTAIEVTSESRLRLVRLVALAGG